MRDWNGWTIKISLFLILLLCCDMPALAATQTQRNTQAKTLEQTKEAIIKQAFDDIRTQRFIEENYDQLKLLRDQQSVIVFTMDGLREYPYQFDDVNGGKTGVFPLMVLFFEQLTSITFLEDSNTYTRDEMMLKLTAGEIDWILGLALGKQTEYITRTQYHAIDIIPMQEELFYDPYLLVARIQEEAYTKQTIPYYYWGCLENQKQEMKGTELEAHTVTYNTMAELEQAFVSEDIEGMLLTKGCERYLSLTKNKEYQTVEDIIIPARKYYMTAKDNHFFRSILPKIIPLYLSLYEDYFEEGIKNSLTQVANRYPGNQSVWTYIFLGGIIIFTFCFLFYSYRTIQQRKQVQRLLEYIPKRAKQEQDVFVVFLKRLMICSKFHFQVFGFPKKHLKRTMPMSELTLRLGFDFEKHYTFQVRNKESLVRCNFELYINGIRYQFEEVMAISDHMIVSKVYREEM